MPSKRTEQIKPFIVMDVLENACDMECRGENVIHLEVGEPDFDIPDCVKQAVCRAMDEGHTHYTHSQGILSLREAISAYYKRQYNVDVDPANIIVSSGTSPAMFLVFSALLNPDDEVIISDPHYACYSNFIRFVQGIPIHVPVYEEDGFQYRPEDILQKCSPRTRGIVINSPSNPTGNMLSKKRMKTLARMADAPDGPFIVSDEIYHGLVYEGRAHSILEFTDRAFVLNGFSKLYAMTGLRLGYAIVPKEYVRVMQKLHQNFFISANAAVQMAGIAALENAGPDVENMKNIYNTRRRFMVRRLKEIGFGITIEPTGAFYVFANARHLSMNSYELAFDILKNAHVGVAPGIDFGENGEGYLRFSYANGMENIREGLNRLEAYVKKRL